jgi:sulfate transport system ATP-binding protein
MSIQFEQVTKLYNGQPVVNDVSLEIASGEFFVLLGPSGSGKSTLLRALAGLTAIDHGRILLHGRDVTHVSARDRGTGFVFQHYALFRHMTVADNIEFALKVRKVKAADRRARRKELLRLVDLDGFDERLPGQLSGGQQQRVAVARALAHEPAVLLLDEPFGALDAKIRVELRATVREVQRRLGMTTILVTHDQEEAFSLADRLGVMQMGRLLETGSAEQLYRQPATRFVATFLGAANLFLGDASGRGLQLGQAQLASGERRPATATSTGEVVLVVRPEDVEVAAAPTELSSRAFASGHVRALAFGGQSERLTVQLEHGSGVEPAIEGEGPAVTVEATRSAREQLALPLAVGRRVALGIRRFHALPTPISSFHLYAVEGPASDALVAAPLLGQLMRSMQARAINIPVEPDAALDERSLAGVVVVPSGRAAIPNLVRLARAGAKRVLVLPQDSRLPNRVLIHSDADRARPDLLALVSSVLRHLPVEASFVSVRNPAASRPEVVASQRHLLDARTELRGAHGLDVRTDTFIGDAPGWVQTVVTQTDPVLVVLGIQAAAAELERRLSADYLALFTEATRCPVLLALSPPGSRQDDAAADEPRSVGR